MRYFTALTPVVVVLAGCLLTASTPVATELTVARARALTFGSTTRHIYDRNGTELATVRDGIVTGRVTDLAALEPLANPELLSKAIDAGVSITQAVCSNGNAVACGVVGTIAVFAAFFVAWYGRRDFGGPLIDLNTDYPAVQGCGTVCRLRFEAAEGPWRSIGNVTVDGVFHDLHYQRNGTFSGLRSIQYGPAEQTSRRQNFENGEDNNDGGMVVDYYWLDENETAYDSFDSTSTLIDDFANDAVGDLVQADTIIECAEFEDSDGVLNAGLLTVGWNGQAYNFDEPNESRAITAECYSEASG